MICAQCGTENPAENSLCGQCGRSLAEPPQAAPRRVDRAALVRREAAILSFFLLALLFASFGTWYVLIYQRSAVSVVRKFIEADLSGQFSRQPEYVAKRWDSGMALSFFQQLRKQARQSPFQNYRIASASEGASTARVYVDVPFTLPALPGTPSSASPPLPAPPPMMSLTFVLIREEGEWKIDSTQTLSNVAGALAAAGWQQYGGSLPSIPPMPPPGIPGYPLNSPPPVTPIPNAPAPGSI